MSTEMIRVLLCDGSSIMRRIVRGAIDAEAEIAVVGEAESGVAGVEVAKEESPDVIVMAVDTSVLDDLEALNLLKREEIDTPVVMFSSLTERGAAATLDALAAGACDFAVKPALVGPPATAFAHVRKELLPKIKLWASAPQSSSDAASPDVARLRGGQSAAEVPTSHHYELVTVGCPAGGSEALSEFVAALPASLSVPVAIVHHMPPAFTAQFAERLDRVSAIRVVEARDGMLLKPGTVAIAPGGQHAEIESQAPRYRFKIRDGSPVHSCMPSIDVLFESAARHCGEGALSIVLTGVGQDGLDGARAVRDAGGHVVVQDEASSEVWGTSGAIWSSGLAVGQVTPQQAAWLVGVRDRQSIADLAEMR